MVQSAFEWRGPFKYCRGGRGFYYKGKYFPIPCKPPLYHTPDCVYDDDELYARHIRFGANAGMNPSRYPFEIFDELPDGWRRGIDDGRFGWGLRGNWDHDSKYLWCENGPMYLNRWPGDSARNPDYRQGLVRR